MVGLERMLDAQHVTSEDEALEWINLVGPVVETLSAQDLTSELRGAIARMAMPSLASCMADWWIKVTTGEVANSHCYQLVDEITGELRVAMEAIRDIHAKDVPPARWLAARLKLEAAVKDLQPGAHGPLELDYYGPSKLADERTLWDNLLQILDPMIVSLQRGRPAPGADWEDDFRRALASTRITPNSRRWKEMEARAWQLADHLHDLSELAEVVARVSTHADVPNLEAVPTEVITQLGDSASVILRSIVSPEGVDHDPAATSKRLDPALEGLDLQHASLFARLLAPWIDWCNESDLPVPQLPAIEGELSTYRDLELRAAELEEAGLDTDEMRLAILDGDFKAARVAGDEIGQSQEVALVASRMRKLIEATRARLTREDVLDSTLAALLDEAEAAARSGDEDAAQASLKRLNDAAEAELGNRRRKDFEQAIVRLGVLGARREQLFDLQAELNSGRIISKALVDEAAAMVDDLRSRRFDEGAQHRGRLDEVLNAPGAVPKEIADEFRTRVPAKFSPDLSDERLVEAVRAIRALAEEIEQHRVRRWTSQDGEDALLKHIVAYCTDRIDYSEHDLRRLYVALKTKPFVILAGLTGSGKSSIVRLFAEAIGAGGEQFRRVAVRPDWIDQSEVLGYINPVSQRFEPGWLADVVRACQRSPEKLHFVLLDEMNLAPVEQYLAELLSAMEEARAGFGNVKIPLYTRGAAPSNADEWPAELVYPANLFIVGTVNIDESTRPLSDRVIDRANVLQLGITWTTRHHEESAAARRAPWVVEREAWNGLVEQQPSDVHHDLLVQIAKDMQAVGIGIGLRSHIELERFLANAEGVLSSDEALDFGVLQRVIPKVRGFKRELEPALERVRNALVPLHAARSMRVLDKWLDSKVSGDTFLDGTAPHLDVTG